MHIAAYRPSCRNAPVHLRLFTRCRLEAHKRTLPALASPRAHYLFHLRQTAGVSALPDLQKQRLALCTPAPSAPADTPLHGSNFQPSVHARTSAALPSDTSSPSCGPDPSAARSRSTSVHHDAASDLHEILQSQHPDPPGCRMPSSAPPGDFSCAVSEDCTRHIHKTDELRTARPEISGVWNHPVTGPQERPILELAHRDL